MAFTDKDATVTNSSAFAAKNCRRQRCWSASSDQFIKAAQENQQSFPREQRVIMTAQAFSGRTAQFRRHAKKTMSVSFVLGCAKQISFWMGILVMTWEGERLAERLHLLTVLSLSKSVVNAAAADTKRSPLPSWPAHLRAELPSILRPLRKVPTANNISALGSTEATDLAFTEALWAQSLCSSAGAEDVERCVRQRNTQTRTGTKGKLKRAKAVGILLQHFHDHLGSAGMTEQRQLDETLLKDRMGPQALSHSMLLASYVKFVEAGGHRVIPIPATASIDHYRKLFLSIDGLLLPGGSAAIHSREAPYYKATKLFLDWAVEAMIIWAGGDNFSYFTVEDYRNLDHTRQLRFLPAARSSRLFGPDRSAAVVSTAITANEHDSACGGQMRRQAPSQFDTSQAQTSKSFSVKMEAAPYCSRGREARRQRPTGKAHDKKPPAGEESVEATLEDVIDKHMLVDLLRTRETAYFHHTYRITRWEFERDTILSQRFALLATCVVPKSRPIHDDSDSDNEFVAIVESTRYPFYGFQFHPEKNIFEHSPFSNIPHDAASRWVATSLGLFFANEVGKSRREQTPFAKEWYHLIERFTPTDLSSPYAPYLFEEAYFFGVNTTDKLESMWVQATT